jgi:hypothetical protein
MPDPRDAVAATFVEPRGMIRSAAASVVGRELLGGVGAVAGSRLASAGTEGSSPLRKGDLAYLAVFADELVLFKARRGALRPKPTSEVIASAARAGVRSAGLAKGRLGGVLERGSSTSARSPAAASEPSASVPGTDPREPASDVTGADVHQCRAAQPNGTWGPDTCPRAGGLDQDVYRDHTP